MKKYLLFLALIPLLSGCFSLRVDYPEINYYRLEQMPGKLEDVGISTIHGSLLIRNFTASDEINSDHFLAIWDNGKVQKYYYHRWITNIAELVTDFIVTRYNNLRVFSDGAIKSGSMIKPDYLLEGSLLEMYAHNNNDDEKNDNYVYLSMRISLLKKVPLSVDKKILLNKVFTVKQKRKNSSVENIADAFSKAMTKITDKTLLDTQKAIFNNQKKQ